MIKSAQSGDEKALEKIYLEQAKSVYYLALKLMKNKEDAEDITQEVFIHMFGKIGELKSPEAFSSWLNRITANKCTNALRKKHEVLDIDSEEISQTDFFDEADSLLVPDKSLDNAETARMIVEIIDNLPIPQRVCVYYYYYEHLTIAQIAENLETNENTVKSRISLAREKIRKELENLNQKEGIKLYSTFPLLLSPILKMSLDGFEMSPELMSGIFSKIGADTVAGATKATTTTATTVTKATTTTATTATKAEVVMAVKTKIAILVIGLLAIAGITASILIASNSDEEFITIKGKQYSTLLTSFDLSNKNLNNEDIEPLSMMTNLTDLYLEENQISDISVLENIPNLENLHLHSNQIIDISPLKDLTNLKSLSLSDNQISDITPLKELTNLTELSLDENQISDIIALTNMTNLTELSLSDNPISDSQIEELRKALPNAGFI